MLIVGTIIGAGFASGRELVSFFGSGISLWVAFLCGGAIFGLCALFLWIGSVTGARNVTQLNERLIGRFHFLPDSFLLINSLIVLSGMLAGMDSLGSLFFPLSPLYAVAAGVLGVIVVHKGIKGLLRCNGIVVPCMILALLTVCGLSIAGGWIDFSLGRFTLTTLPTTAVYVSMNMILASTVLTTLGPLKKKQILLSAGIAAAVMTGLLVALILALNSCGDSTAEMPVLEMAKAISPILYVLIALVIGVSIFTTMLTAMSGLCAWFSCVLGKGIFCPIVVLLAGLLLSRLGFLKVVGLLYPVIGVLGLFYMLLCIVFALRCRRSAKAPNAFFDQCDHKIHQRRKHAKNHR